MADLTLRPESDASNGGNPNAFPSGDFTGCEPGRGMTLRDWFAGQALAGDRVKDTMREYELDARFGKYATGITREQILAANAYRLADAMLAERARHA